MNGNPLDGNSFRSLNKPLKNGSGREPAFSDRMVEIAMDGVIDIQPRGRWEAPG